MRYEGMSEATGEIIVGLIPLSKINQKSSPQGTLHHALLSPFRPLCMGNPDKRSTAAFYTWDSASLRSCLSIDTKESPICRSSYFAAMAVYIALTAKTRGGGEPLTVRHCIHHRPNHRELVGWRWEVTNLLASPCVFAFFSFGDD